MFRMIASCLSGQRFYIIEVYILLRTLILKSPAKKSILLALVFSERIFLKYISVMLRSPSGCLYTTLSLLCTTLSLL